ncbi:MAG: recombinase family protein [Paludibaculum sp.]
MRVAIYARVSTSDQKALIQIEELQRYCRTRDWDVWRVYSDAMSGAAFERPGRNALMKDAEARMFEAVLVTKLDRWGRSLVDLMDSLNMLEKYRVRWIAVDQNIDTDRTNPLGRLMLQMLGASRSSSGIFSRSA